MSKKLWLFIILFFVVVAHAILLAMDWTRPMVFDTYFQMGTAIWTGILAIGQSEWWLLYGFYITAGAFSILGGTIVALYYKGKIHMWQWGGKKGLELAYGQRQPAPAPTPTPLAPTPVATEPQPQPEQKQEATA